MTIEINKSTLDKVIEITLQAGEVIMPYYREEKDLGLEAKNDQSPVTLADQEAEKLIIEKLEQAFPGIEIIAEEKMSAASEAIDVQNQEYFFLVDPLDGTKEFIHKRGEFTVNIAVIYKGEPVLGVVYAPVLGEVYSGYKGGGAYFSRNTDLDNSEPLVIDAKEPAIAVASRSHMSEETQQFLDENGIEEFISAGSSLKFCMVASGKADIYPRFGRTMEWDTAAGDAVVRAAGGITVDVDDTALLYGKQNQSHDSDFANPYFIVRGKAA